MMRNDAVVRAFSRGESASAGNLWTDGRFLYSYKLKIAERRAGLVVVGDYTSGGGGYHSQTTSCHVGLARRVADTVMLPELFAGLNPNHRFELPF